MEKLFLICIYSSVELFSVLELTAFLITYYWIGILCFSFFHPLSSDVLLNDIKFNSIEWFCWAPLCILCKMHFVIVSWRMCYCVLKDLLLHSILVRWEGASAYNNHHNWQQMSILKGMSTSSNILELEYSKWSFVLYVRAERHDQNEIKKYF